ncbi:hypothetical protein SDC9_178782 [bioreactor metagenome]|uniref:Uncharacterized protein n=1 Tax=bioreactor metagenome TaxID=1076179 RepID=A0A645GX53_9ZZZZ
MLVHVCPAFIPSGQRIKCIDVSVRLLGGRKLVDPLIGFPFQLGVGVVYKAVSHPLKCLVNVGIIVKNARMFA